MIHSHKSVCTLDYVKWAWLLHILQGRTGVKNEARELKVAIMKMKINAIGDPAIPQVTIIHGDISIVHYIQRVQLINIYSLFWKC